MIRNFTSIAATASLALLLGCEGQLGPMQSGEYADNATTEENAITEGNAMAEATTATCTLEPIGESGVEGSLNFRQDGDTVYVTGTITGLEPGKHGFHVHETGDLSDKQAGKSAGGHFNPTDKPHGKPSDEERHIGDLGNIEANDEGVAEVNIEDTVISLEGPQTVVGRAIVVHAGEDQFTQPTGDAGARVAFGVIE